MTGMTALDPDLFASCGSVRPPVQVGGKWDTQIIICLLDGERRFSELQVPLRHISPKVLTESLRGLERNGFVVRTVHSHVPRHVTYALTPLGRSLTGPMEAACAWSRRHLADMVQARDQYDATA